MCGIAGMHRFDGLPADPRTVAEMAALLSHRGPDDSGVWAMGPIALGHQRLSIIDTAHSHQPMASHDGRFHLTFNGEILNYRELRSTLHYPFATSGDTEVLLALLATQGTAGIARIEGQFAFALHDTFDGSTVLVRDRLGILPLYYASIEGAVVFASEVKALVPALGHPLRMDEVSVVDYLTRRAVPAPHTLFEDIRKVQPGHVVRISAQGAVSEARYWSLADVTEEPSPGPDAATERLAAVLQDAVARNLVADVPVGAYLSGGVDSSLIVALVRHLDPDRPLKTFAAGFGDDGFDERPAARRVSELLSTEHHEVDVRAADFLELWPLLTWHRDAPLSEPADVAVHRLAERAGESVKVVLSGEGSDELFAGYPKYRFAPKFAAAHAVPHRLREPLAHRVQAALPARAGRARIALRALAASEGEDALAAWFAPYTARERAALAGTAYGRGQPDVVAAARGDLTRRMQFVDCHGWLSDNLLERGDRMTMSASVELRPPFLDREVVELAFRLPTGLKVRHRQGKWVVKEVARRYLPPDIVDRRKVGFRVPLDAWFRGGLRSLAGDLLLGSSSLSSAIFDRSRVRKLVDDHLSGRRDEEIRIWTLLSLEVWHDVFIRGGGARPPAAAPLATSGRTA